MLESIIFKSVFIGNFSDVLIGRKFKVNITKQFPTKTKNFLIKTLLERIDSGVKRPGKFEYDKQNLLKHQKTQVWLKKLDISFTTSCHFTKFEFGPYQKSFQLKQFRKEQILA